MHCKTVMTGSATQTVRFYAFFGNCLLKSAHDPVRAWHAFGLVSLNGIDFNAAVVGDNGQGGQYLATPIDPDGPFGGTQFDGQIDMIGDDIYGIRGDFDLADNTNHTLGRGTGCLDLMDDVSGGNQRILARMHRCGSGVTCLATDLYAMTFNSGKGGDNADRQIHDFKYRALFDMDFDEADYLAAIAL